jgi:DnaK suppressor protein
MRKKEINRIHKELREKKVEILNRLMKDRENYRENLTNEVGDLADVATDSIERELIYDLSVTEKQELEEIDNALQKIEDKNYGKCESCGEDIAMGRLKVKPYAKYCTKCKEDHERHKNHPHYEEESGS